MRVWLENADLCPRWGSFGNKNGGNGILVETQQPGLMSYESESVTPHFC